MATFGEPTTQSKKSNIPPLDSNNYPSHVVGIVLMGSYLNFFDKEEPPKQKLLFILEPAGMTFETEEGETLPRTVPYEINYAGGDKATLTKIKGSLNASDVGELLGKECLAEVQKKEKKSAPGEFTNRVLGVSAPIAGFELPTRGTEPYAFNFYMPDYDEFKKLPVWIQKKITSTDNQDFQGSALQQLIAANETQTEDTPVEPAIAV